MLRFHDSPEVPPKPGPHEHDFGEAAFRRIGFCSTSGCAEARVGKRPWRGVSRWRELTSQERISLLAFQMKELGIVQGLMVVHGGHEKGLKRYRELRG